MTGVVLGSMVGAATLTVVSFVTGGSFRSETEDHLVTSIGLKDSILDSQRRRLPGRGI
jgi:hypothetical protein